MTVCWGWEWYFEEWEGGVIITKCSPDTPTGDRQGQGTLSRFDNQHHNNTVLKVLVSIMDIYVQIAKSHLVFGLWVIILRQKFLWIPKVYSLLVFPGPRVICNMLAVYASNMQEQWYLAPSPACLLVCDWSSPANTRLWLVETDSAAAGGQPSQWGAGQPGQRGCERLRGRNHSFPGPS